MTYGVCEYLGHTADGLVVWEYRSHTNGTWWTVGYKIVHVKPIISD